MLTVERVQSPLGELVCVASPDGVLRIFFTSAPDALGQAQQIADELGERLGGGSPGQLSQELGEYFAGERTAFTVPVDWRLIPAGFRRRALQAVSEIPYGQRASYGEVAEMSGSPRAARAVGSACAGNPVPFLIPCHRVIRADGSLGEYGGTPEAKRWLLELESRTISLGSGAVTPQ